MEIPGAKAGSKLSLFEIFYDVEHLQWDFLSEKMEYKMKLHFDAKERSLMIPTTEVSQAYHLFDILLSVDAHALLVGS
jgi:hypothetical protein